MMQIVGALMVVFGFGVALERLNFVINEAYGVASEQAITRIIVATLVGIAGVCIWFWSSSTQRHRLADARALHGIHLRWQRVDGPITEIMSSRLGAAEPTAGQLGGVDGSWPEPVLRELDDRATLSLSILREWRALLQREGTVAAVETVDEIVAQRQAVQAAVRAALR